MRKIKTEVTLVGSGAAAMLALNRFRNLGVDAVLVNPASQLEIDDVRPYNGLGLWNAAYRSGEATTLQREYDKLVVRMREVFPAAVDLSGLSRTEHWGILSSTPVHREVTANLEKEYFRLERKSWSSGQVRLVNPENVMARARGLGIDLSRVSQVEGAVVKNHSLWWDAAGIGNCLSQFIHSRPEENRPILIGSSIKRRFGRKLDLRSGDGEEISLEAESALLIFLTGNLLPHVKNIVAGCQEPWIQGVRKRRREQHCVWFERLASLEMPPPLPQTPDDDLSIELGETQYHWGRAGGTATWHTVKGPDGLEKVVDEGLRLHSLPVTATRFVRSARAFRLEWDWKVPQWRETKHNTYWATSFEGDLVAILELLWNLPTH